MSACWHTQTHTSKSFLMQMVQGGVAHLLLFYCTLHLRASITSTAHGVPERKTATM